MKRSVVVGGAVVLALLLGTLGAGAYSSARAEQVAQQGVSGLRAGLAATPYARVVEQHYQRGLFQSSEDFTLGLGPPGPDELRLTVHNRILHGPLPGFSTLGQAVIETELRWPPDIQRQLDAALGDRKISIRTVVGLDGASTTLLHVPAGTVSQDGASVSFAALDGSVRLDGPRSDLRLLWPELKFVSGNDTTRLSGLRLTGAQTGPGSGHSRLSVASVEVAGETPTTLSGLSVSSQTSRSGDLQDASVRYEVQSLQAGGQSLGRSGFTLALRHLSVSSLERLGALGQRLQGQAAPDPAALWPQAVGALESLLRAAPELAVEDVAVELPQGQLTADARLSLDDAAGIRLPPSLEEGGAAGLPAMLLPHLHLRAQLSADESTAETFSGGLSELHDLMDQGFLRRDGDQLTGTAEFARGQLTVNGRPVPLD